MGLFSLPGLDMFGGGGGGGSSSFSGGGAFNKENTNYNESSTLNQSNSGNYTVGNGALLLREGAVYDASSRVNTSVFDSSSRWTDNSQQWWDGSDRSTHISDSRTTDNSQRWELNDSSNRSTNISDSSSRDYSQVWNDGRTTTITNTGTDAAEIVKYNAALLQALGESQGDAVKLISRMGAESMATSSKAATDLFATASAEAGKAWGQTIDKAGELLGELFTTTKATVSDTVAAARSVASSSIAATPEASSATTTRYAMLGAAAIVLAVILTRKA